MSRASKRWLDPRVEEKIHRLLVECVVESNDQQAAGNFIDILLTRTEKLMIGKRIAIALMLVKGRTPLEIDEKLKVALPTIYTVKTWLEEKGAEYQSLLKKIAVRDEQQARLHQDKLMEAEGGIFPPRPGINWGEHKRRQWQEANKTKVPF